MKLSQLTPEQVELMDQVREEYLSLFFSLEFNEQRAKELVDFIYFDLLKLDKPRIYILESPLACQYTINFLSDYGVGKQVWDQVGKQVNGQVWEQVRKQVSDQVSGQVWDQVSEQVWEQVWEQVRKQVSDQVSGQVWDQVSEQVSGEKLKYYYNCYYLDTSDFYWLSFYDFFQQIDMLKHELFDKYKNLVKNAGIFLLNTFLDSVFISKPPIYIKKNDSSKLHSINSPAIEFKDGFKLYFVNGIHFSQEDFELFFLGSPAAKDILNMRNQEQKAVVLQHVGYESLADELKLKEISRHVDTHKNVNILYKSSEIPINLVKARDSSTERIYYLGVPKNITDCLDALAWTFNLSAGEYKNRIES